MTSVIHWLSIAEAAELIAARKLSPVELTEALLRRIEALEGRVNAFITVDGDAAMAAARTAADEITKGVARGPLHGVPVALKDIFGVAGVRMTAGSKILAENAASEDAEATARLKAAGAVILGKLNLHEFAFGATGVNPHYGPARNPWDLERITGGSSSGSGASVASGECPAALGTDTGGSIRIPASLCGIVGLKPTYGRVSKRGVLPLSWSLDHVGPMTRTVEDAGIILQAIAGRDDADASTRDEPLPDYNQTVRVGVQGLRIGVPKQFFFENVDAEVESAVRSALSLLEAMGAVIIEVDAPLISEIPGGVTAIMLPEALAYHQKWMTERPDDYGDDVRYRLELGATFLAVHYVQAQRRREMAVAAWRAEVFSKVEMIATPTTPITARPIEEGDLQVTFNLIRFTNPLNFLGVPAISVPCGFTGEGLPVGLQLAGRWWDEATVLRAAHTYEQATDWHQRRPPL
ncbi:MAG: Asp-tRNA(Asn)/Glu-tRNA(Gln) amidotransferase subunit GatA [Chloroflexi bacterium]|nr:MAG: Asp-tRNA(Asn)/Glu-tRNA(Gln) amidotransferase subunit GatA [Chloroflexota bacterium]